MEECRSEEQEPECRRQGEGRRVLYTVNRRGKELRHYRKHFQGKTVFCNCDDPFESNFFKYFVLNFNRLGLKKLIATCYTGSPIAGSRLSLFDVVPDAQENRPYKAMVTTVYDATGDGGVDMNDIAELFRQGENELSELEGNGDFRSDECLALMDEADIVATNPPFSLFNKDIDLKREDAIQALDEAIGIAVFSQFTEAQNEQFNALLDSEGTTEIDYNRFFQTAGIDVEKTIAEAMQQFAIEYVAKLTPSDITQTAPMPASVVEPDSINTKTGSDSYVGIGRNDPCPCGSGKKFKKCHGVRQE